MNITKADRYKRIEVLNFTLWENRAFKTHIEAWLRNFKNETDQSYALYMLSRMMYFSADNIRNLLRTLYRDKIRYPLIRDIRKRNGNTLDPEVLEPEFFEELKNTRFLGVGNPSESGVHLLYYFRQENNIPKDLFVNTDDLVIYEQNEDGEVHAKLRDKFKNVKRFVFIDDLCGSGQQATSNDSNVRRCVTNLRSFLPSSNISYLMLFGLKDGVEYVRNFIDPTIGIPLYDHVDAVIELDESYMCFSEKSRFFTNIDNYDKIVAKDIAYKYGYPLSFHLAVKQGLVSPYLECVAKHRALGFGNNQLLISMHHNTPDNTLPIIWFDEDKSMWTPIFRRYNKNYTEI